MSFELGGRALPPGAAVVFAALLGALAGASGCYNPHVVSGQLQCASISPQCPDGFSCASGYCVSNSAAGQGGAGGAGAGGAGGTTCANPIQPLCTSAAAPAVCDPVCQTGCPCGQRCVVTTGGTKCVAPAAEALTVGMVCRPEADACAPGLTCLKEACGTDLGRCYRFCDPNQPMCGAGVCGTPVRLPDNSDSGQRVCDLGNQQCDPFSGTGCVDPALFCYALLPNQTCDCPTGVNAQEGDKCTYYNDCAVGLACVGTTTGDHCVKLCQAAADCPGSTCTLFGAIGYCN